MSLKMYMKNTMRALWIIWFQLKMSLWQKLDILSTCHISPEVKLLTVKGHEDLRKMTFKIFITQTGNMATWLYNLLIFSSLAPKGRHDKFLETADIILKTGLPNYRGA